MSDRIHDDEPDTGETVVRALLAAECPDWSDRPLTYLQASGTDNAMWRVALDGEPDVAVRLLRRPGAAANVEAEIAVLRHLEHTTLSSLVTIPRVRHLGRAGEAFPHRWSILEWIGGVDAWAARDDLVTRPLTALATDLARAVEAIGEIGDAPVKARPAGSRGGPLGPLLQQLDRWLTDPQWRAGELLDVAAVRRRADEARELVDQPVIPGFVHGDLIPGNLLVADGRLGAILDWGGAGWGDRAQDLAPAWAVLPANDRAAFRQALEVDDAAWIRGRAFELEHAVGGVLYYRPRRHPLGDIMTRTLGRILDDH